MSSRAKRFFSDIRDRIKTSVRMKIESPFIILALILIIALGILVRCSPIFRTEALIKAFDPWIQYYTADYLTEHSLYEYFNWHSFQFWYPSGLDRWELRPGLTFLTAGLYKVLTFFGVNVTIFDVCYTWPVILGGLTILVMYFLGKEILDSRCGLLAAFFIAFSPGHMQRTVLGFYDNETIGVFCVLATFLFFIKSIKTGKFTHGIIAGIFLGILSLSWGGLTYGFLILPLTALILIIAGKYSARLLGAYASTAGIGLIFYLLTPLFQPTHIINRMELVIPLGFLGFMILFHVFNKQKTTNPDLYDNIWKIIKWGSIPALIIFGIIFWSAPEILPFGLGSRLDSILNPTIRNEINLVASVGEHKPSPWSVFYFNTLIPVILTPLGVYFAIKRSREEDILMITFSLTLLYFTGSMIRIILLLAPALALIGSYGLTYILKFFGSLFQKEQQITRRRKRQVRKTLGASEAVIVFALVGVMMFTQINHAATTSVEQMSWSELVAGGTYHDWEESLTYLRENLDSEDVVVSWWDYGYWLSVIGNVTTVNDNGTMNHTRLGHTGMAFMQTNEIYSAKVFRQLKADYALVYFGHLISGLGGDEGKWPWMLRICNDHTAKYESFGYREDNWKEDQVFDESEYINSSTGLYEDNWFDSTLVKLMFYGEATTLSSARTQLEGYYATQIEGNEQQGVNPRQDDNGNLWADHIPENGQYDFTCFVPYYFSSNHLVKVYKLDYTALESSFDILNPQMFANGLGNAEIVNTGSHDLDLTRIAVNNIWYNLTAENNDYTVTPGEKTTVWFDTNVYSSWDVGNPYNLTVEVNTDALAGRQYTFTNYTEEKVVLETPEYGVEIDRENSAIIAETYSSPLQVYLNVTNTGEELVKISNVKLNNNPITLLNTTSRLIPSGVTQEIVGYAGTGGYPSVITDIKLETVENATDEVQMAVNMPDHKLTILSHEREMISDEMLLSKALQDHNRKLVFPDESSSILYENGTLRVEVQNTGSNMLGLEGLMINDELIDWADWSVESGDLMLSPNETAFITTEISSVVKNKQYRVIVNATGQSGLSVASDVGVFVPVKDGKSVHIVTYESEAVTEVIANETIFVSVKNVGLESITVDSIELNSTGPFNLILNDAQLLYGDDFTLDTFEVCKFAINVTGIKINETNEIDLTVNADGVSDTEEDLIAQLPYGGETLIVVPGETYADSDHSIEDRIHLGLQVAGFHNQTIDTITVNGTYIDTSDMIFGNGLNTFGLSQENYVEILASDFGGGDMVDGEFYEIVIVTLEGSVVEYTVEADDDP